MSEIYYIVAGHYSEFAAFKERKSGDGHSYRYLHDINDIIGLRNIKGFYIGSWRNRQDIEHVIERIKITNAQKNE